MGRRSDHSREELHAMMLAAAPGTEITVEAKGRDAADAVAALLKLIDDKFDED